MTAINWRSFEDVAGADMVDNGASTELTLVLRPQLSDVGSAAWDPLSQDKRPQPHSWHALIRFSLAG